MKSLGLRLDVNYFGETRTYSLPSTTPPNENDYYIHYGYVQFTEIGLSLSRIAGGQEVSGFFDYLESEFSQKNIVAHLSGEFGGTIVFVIICSAMFLFPSVSIYFALELSMFWRSAVPFPN